MGLRTLAPLEPEYSSDSVDIASAFMNPCLERSVAYDRVTGYFSSAVFVLMWEALRSFVLENDGTIRILCSPEVSEADARSIRYGYEVQSDQNVADLIADELRALLESRELARATEVLATLLVARRLEIRIAQVDRTASEATKRLFHDKVGLFLDAEGDRVGFRGSMNETFMGLSPLGNIESIDVWPSWADGRDRSRVENAVHRFERIWANEVPGIQVTSLPEDTVAALQEVARDISLEDALTVLKEELSSGSWRTGWTKLGVEPRAHQEAAVVAWLDNENRGIFKHATGSGKTLTALRCIQISLDAGLTPVVVVPSEDLLSQWNGELRDRMNIYAVLCGGGHSAWQSQSLVRRTLQANDGSGAVVAVLPSAMSQAFLAQMRGYESRVFLVGDEVHRLGSRGSRKVLDDFAPAMCLGLSATPSRAGDPEGTDFVMKKFGGIIHEYGLQKAISDGVLVPYTYRPHVVYLDDEEQAAWDKETESIRRLTAMRHAENPPPWLGDRLKLHLIQRARIAKSARAKVRMAQTVLEGNAPPLKDGRWLVYCDDLDQLRGVHESLLKLGLRTWEYHSQMAGDRKATLAALDTIGGIVVSIRCLDEGVDIPSVNHALILASSRNPREFIQRRGRILRRSPGKAMAHLEDVLTLPNHLAGSDEADSLVLGEVARALEFARASMSSTATTYLEDLWVSLGRTMAELEAIGDSGFEDD